LDEKENISPFKLYLISLNNKTCITEN
jgi:hypothetical protein